MRRAAIEITKEPNNRRTEGEPRSTVPLLVLWFFGSLIFLPAALAAQDLVIASSASDPSVRIKKSGQILDYTGTELKLRTTLGVEETIPAGRVVEIQTRWSPSHEAGRAASGEGRLDDAIAALRQAKREETRSWAARQIMADLAGCYLEAGLIDAAGEEFLGILASDPATRHFDVIPVAWRGVALDPAAEARARAWLATPRRPVASLLGASWLLATRRAEAVAALEEIAKSSDPRLAGLAAIQLWRTRLVTASPNDVHRWQDQLEKMPPDIQAAGWYVLGDILARLNRPEAAALAYLKSPLLFRQQRALTAEALLAAGKQLEKMSQTPHAAELYRELVRDFPSAPAAKEAAGRLDALKAIAK
jgi:tetratricopeptide (TPR) repeat protein